MPSSPKIARCLGPTHGDDRRRQRAWPEAVHGGRDEAGEAERGVGHQPGTCRRPTQASQGRLTHSLRGTTTRSNRFSAPLLRARRSSTIAPRRYLAVVGVVSPYAHRLSVLLGRLRRAGNRWSPRVAWCAARGVAAIGPPFRSRRCGMRDYRRRPPMNRRRPRRCGYPRNRSRRHAKAWRCRR